jgi:glutamyl-tRNA synthetase
MLALLGWNPGTDREIFTLDELVAEFSLERINKSGARFDPVKAKWFNHIYIQRKTNNQLAMEFREILRTKGYHYDINRLEILAGLVRERISFVKDMWDETSFFFRPPGSYDEEAVRKRWKEESPAILNDIAGILGNTEDFSAQSVEEKIKNLIAGKGYNNGTAMHSLRLVLVGELRGRVFLIL